MAPTRLSFSPPRSSAPNTQLVSFAPPRSSAPDAQLASCAPPRFSAPDAYVGQIAMAPAKSLAPKILEDFVAMERGAKADKKRKLNSSVPMPALQDDISSVVADQHGSSIARSSGGEIVAKGVLPSKRAISSQARGKVQHEASRNQYMLRTGKKGPGSSKAFKYTKDDAISQDKAHKAAMHALSQLSSE